MDPFIIKIVLSIVLGGSYAAILTWVSERFGSKIGGLLIGLPSTSLVGLIFIAWTQNPAFAVATTLIIPAAISAASLFVIAFVLSYSRWGGLISFVLAMLFWSILTLPLIAIHLDNMGWSLIIGAFYFMAAILIVRKFSDQKLTKIRVTPKTLFIRAVTSGSIIGLAVVLGNLLGPLWGGLMSSFPAVFASSMIILLHAHGIEFTSSVAKRMPYGNLTNAAFAVSFYFIVPHLGMLLGTALAYFSAILTAVIIYFGVFPYQQREK